MFYEIKNFPSWTTSDKKCKWLNIFPTRDVSFASYLFTITIYCVGEDLFTRKKNLELKIKYTSVIL